MFKKPKKPTASEDRSSQASAERFSLDQRLRKHGFVIHARPKNKPALWSYGGAVYNEWEALELVEDIEASEKK